jgi:glutamate racemase
MTLSSPLRHAIGVFDSGVGGLTVLDALRRRMPHRDFVYVGDTARVPYGRKPPEMVAGFAREITAFVCRLGVEGVVVACNTASAVALPRLAEECAVPVWGVIDAGVAAATRVTRTGSVGVIGTQATIRSRAYQGRLEARGLQAWGRACPMLVHVVEEGLADSPEAAILMEHYLEGRPELDTMILGCTHYPLLRAAIQQAAGDSVTLVDSAEVTAEVVSAAFPESVDDGRAGRIVHFVTGDPAAFTHTARVIGALHGDVLPLPLTELTQAELEDART